MSSMRPQLVETAQSLLVSDAALPDWAEAGFGQLLLTEAEDGFGGDWGDAEAVLRLAGYHQPQLDLAPLIVAPARGDPVLNGALATVALIGGALQRILEMSIDYANGRVQFGKPIGKQQAVQQALAVLAEEAAIAAVAAQAAATARDAGEAAFEIACAKLRANRAAAAGAAIAHQVHGAIGFTREFALHRYTRRLNEWRSEHGGTAHWSGVIGELTLETDGDSLWPRLTG